MMNGVGFLLKKMKRSKYLFVATLQDDEKKQDNDEKWNGKILALVRMFKTVIL